MSKKKLVHQFMEFSGMDLEMSQQFLEVFAIFQKYSSCSSFLTKYKSVDWDFSKAANQFLSTTSSVIQRHKTTQKKCFRFNVNLTKKKPSKTNTNDQKNVVRAPIPAKFDILAPEPIRTINLPPRRQSKRSMFGPPTNLNSTFNLEHLKKLAAEERKWILVNIQDVSEPWPFISKYLHFCYSQTKYEQFPCHQLDQGTWSNAKVKKIIQENFYFWQV